MFTITILENSKTFIFFVFLVRICKKVYRNSLTKKCLSTIYLRLQQAGENSLTVSLFMKLYHVLTFTENSLFYRGIVQAVKGILNFAVNRFGDLTRNSIHGSTYIRCVGKLNKWVEKVVTVLKHSFICNIFIRYWNSTE